MLTIGNGKCDNGVSNGLFCSTVESNKVPLNYESQDLFVIPRYSKQAGEAKTLESVSVGTNSLAVDEGDEAPRRFESAVAEREEVLMLAPVVSAAIEEDSAVLSVPGTVGNQENVEVESEATNEEEHVSSEPELIAAEERAMLVADEPVEDAGEQGSVGVDHGEDEQLGVSEGPSSAPVQNCHPMVTRSKKGIFKPKIFVACSTEEPGSVHQALADPLWK
ncbi:hypothetical protein V6N13_010158 [Hibiscus sabdariffa]